MPRTKGEVQAGFNCPRFVPLIATLGIGQYITIDMGSFLIKPDTICAYVEQAACILSITTRSCRDGDTHYVGRFRNPLVNEMKLTAAERKQRIETVRMLAGTMSNWEIADKLGITPHNLAYIARSNNISLRYYDRGNGWTPERDEALVGFVLQGKASKDIGALLGVSRSTVDMRLAQLRKTRPEIPVRPHGGYRQGARWDEDQRTLLSDLWNRGARLKAIHAALGHRFSTQQIYNQIARMRGEGFELASRITKSPV